MNPDLMGQWDVVPITCFACAARDRENREASEARSSGRIGDGALDGLYFAVTRRPDL